MLKVGQRVSPIFNMGRKGVITEIYLVPVNHESMGGSFSKLRVARVMFENENSPVDIKIQDLMAAD